MCQWKSATQIEEILVAASDRRLLLTRLTKPTERELSCAVREKLDYDSLSQTAYLGTSPANALVGGAGIVCAGTSDVPVAREAARTLAFYGYQAPLIADVGVGGLWRLMERLEEIRSFSVVIVVAGMEGALFSVLAGLVGGVVIAVPTSVGYGVAEGGKTALNAALSSCSPGMLTVNIDNGFGAACAAVKIMRMTG